MPVYIAKDYNDEILGVVMAKIQPFAYIFWQGQDIYPHHVDEIKEDILDNHPTGVINIVSTKEVTIYENGDYIHNQRGIV